MQKKVFFIFIFVLGSLHVFSQHDLGVKINPGLSQMTTKSKYSPVQEPGVEKYYFVLSGQTGLFYNCHLKERFLIGAELLFVQIRSREYIQSPYTDNVGNYTGEYGTDDVYRNISYLSLPVYVGYNLKKFNLNLGFQINFTLHSGGREKGKVTFNGEVQTWENNYDKLNIKNYDYGPRAGLLYELTDHFSLEANYYYGLGNLLNGPAASTWRWKVQQGTLGVRYRFK